MIWTIQSIAENTRPHAAAVARARDGLWVPSQAKSTIIAITRVGRRTSSCISITWVLKHKTRMQKVQLEGKVHTDLVTCHTECHLHDLVQTRAVCTNPTIPLDGHADKPMLWHGFHFWRDQRTLNLCIEGSPKHPCLSIWTEGPKPDAWATLLPLKMVSPWQGWGTMVGQCGNVCSAAAAQAVSAL